MNTARLQTIRKQQGYHILKVRPGQQIEIHERVGQGNNERIWKFKALVLKVKKPNHVDGTFTVRGKVAGMTIEKVYPLSFNKFEKVLLLDEYKVRRAKLYYLRDKVGKGARMTSIATAEMKGRDLLAEAKALAESETPQVEETPVVSEGQEEQAPVTGENNSSTPSTEEGTTAQESDEVVADTESETAEEQPVTEEAPTEEATEQDDNEENKDA